MFSEKDFERLWFLYKPRVSPMEFPSTRSALATIFHTRHSMTGSRRHRKRLYLCKYSANYRCKHTIFRLDAHYSQPYLCAVTFNNNDYGKRKSKLSGGI